MDHKTGKRAHAVCLCADKRMLIPSLFVATSVKTQLHLHAPNIDVIIFAPAADVTTEHRQWAARHGIELRADITTSSLNGIEILKSRLSSATLMKLLVPEHLGGCYEKILYLDADIIVRDDISRVFALAMGGFPLAAVPSGRLWTGVCSQERNWWLAHFGQLGMTPPYRFFNSGVMLIHIENWNRQQLGARALEFIKRNPKLCFFPDEDALNAVLDGALLELSPLWNMRPGPSNGLGPLVEPVIIHYAGPLKPWRRFAKGKRLFEHRDVYRHYRSFIRETPWPHWLEQQWCLSDLAASVRHELHSLLGMVMQRAQTPHEASCRREELRRYLAEQRYADVEQGITAYKGDILALAGPRHHPSRTLVRELQNPRLEV